MKNAFLGFCLVAFGALAQNKILLPVDSAAYFRLIDTSGIEHTPWVEMQKVRYDHASGLFFGKRDNRWGILDSSLQFQIFPRYDSIYFFKTFLICQGIGKLDIYKRDLTLHRSFENFNRIEFPDKKVKNSNATKLIIHFYEGTFLADHTFNLDSARAYDDAFFYDDLILTRIGDQFGFIGSSDTIIQPQYTSLAFFNHRVLEVMNAQGHMEYYLTDGRKLPDTDSVLQYDDKSAQYKIYKNGKGYLYSAGYFDFEPIVSCVTYQGDDVFCISGFSGKDFEHSLFAFKRDDKIGVCNSKGVVLLAPLYEHVLKGGENCFIVMQEKKFGVVDIHGNWIIEPIYNFIDWSSSGYYELRLGNKEGVATAEGKIIVPIEFDYATATHTGVVTNKAGKKGFYTNEGIMVLNTEWSEVYTENFYDYGISGYLEFVHLGKSCLVNKNGLLTPTNCLQIHYAANTIKYYLSDRFVICHLEDEKITDSTVFPIQNTLVIRTPDPNTKMNQYDNATQFFWSQLTGKYGAIYRHDSGYAIPPIYDKLAFDILIDNAKIDFQGVLSIGDLQFEQKEAIQQLNWNTGKFFEVYNAYALRTSNLVWHTSALDPVIKQSGAVSYNVADYHAYAEYQFLLARHGFTSAGAFEGFPNLDEGESTIDYRTYFQQLNGACNLVITDRNQFSLLSAAPMIYVKDPMWRVLEVSDRQNIILKGNFSYYYNLGNGLIIFSSDDELYGIYAEGEVVIAPEEFSEIVPVLDNSTYYFLMYKQISDIGGISEPKWTVYTYAGPYLPNYYDSVELIHSGYFIITQGGHRQVIDKTGRVIYRIA